MVADNIEEVNNVEPRASDYVPPHVRNGNGNGIGVLNGNPCHPQQRPPQAAVPIPNAPVEAQGQVNQNHIREIIEDMIGPAFRRVGRPSFHKLYPEEYDRVHRIPRGYEVPDFTSFSGTSSEQSTLDYIARFTIAIKEKEERQAPVLDEDMDLDVSSPNQFPSNQPSFDQEMKVQEMKMTTKECIKVDDHNPSPLGDTEEVIEVPQKENIHLGGNDCDNAKATVFTKPDETSTYHIKALYIKAYIDGIPINRVLVYNGTTVNLLPFSSVKKIGKCNDNLMPSDVTVSDFSSAVKKTREILPTQLTVGSRTSMTTFFVIDSSSTYNILLGRDWIHANWFVPSSLHQMFIFWNGAEVEVVKADIRPFKVESHAVDARFYDGTIGPVRFMGGSMISQQEKEEAVNNALKRLSTHAIEMKLHEIEDLAAPPVNATNHDNIFNEITIDELDRASMKLDDLKAEVQDPLLEIYLGADGKPRPTYINLLVDGAAQHKVLSFMDGHNGYNQIYIAEEDVSKTEFRCPGAIGNFEWVVMPFGLKNAGATYQREMNAIFHDMIGKFMEVYIDDLVVKSHNTLDLIDHLRRSFERTRQHGLKMNPLKCAFGVGAVEKHQEAFEAIKNYLISPPVLVPPRKDKPLYLYVSATTSSIGCFLAQEVEKGKEQVVYYLSRTLTDVEYRYSPIEKLCLSLYFAAIKLWHYMLYFNVCIIAKTDIVKYMLTRPLLKGCLALSEFSFKYIPRKAIKGQVVADFLAAHPCLNLGEEFEDANEVMEAATLPWILEFDRSNTAQIAGAGIVFTSPDDDYTMMAFHLDFDCTNNQAEYEALIIGLELLREMKATSVHIKGDSLLVMNQLMQEYNCTSPSLLPYYAMAAQLLDKFDNVSIEHVPRYQNEGANVAAQLASGITFPDDIWKKVEAKAMRSTTHSDVKSFIEEHIVYRFGIPETTTTDCGTNFDGKITSHLERKFGLKFIKSTPYYTQANGSSTGVSPFCLTYGHAAMVPMELLAKSARVAFQNNLQWYDYNDAMMIKLEDLESERLDALNHP
ncbi:reverse transcriptase [Corchorus capsularis]|uniref:Reverse transcriptase n=1 Tax=Corchorus capsularis TaxID=210143 RepID=A0A1R3J9M7_COCAP|nr:reverse transcriptase [Corchorus capsularis]